MSLTRKLEASFIKTILKEEAFFSWRRRENYLSDLDKHISDIKAFTDKLGSAAQRQIPERSNLLPRDTYLMFFFVCYYMVGLATTISVVREMGEDPFGQPASILATLTVAMLWFPALVWALVNTEELEEE